MIISSTPFEYEDVHGFIARTGEQSFELLMNENSLKEFKKFKIVHMLGHLFLHMGYMINEEKWKQQTQYRDSIYYRYGHNIEDNEAYFFACAYVMPIKTFREVARTYLKNDIYYLEPISKELDVPIDQVRQYGIYLGDFRR